MKRITVEKLNTILSEILHNKDIYVNTYSIIGDEYGNTIFSFGDLKTTNNIMKYYIEHKMKYYFISLVPEAKTIDNLAKSTDIIYYYIGYDKNNKYILITKKEIGYKLKNLVLYEYNLYST